MQKKYLLGVFLFFSVPNFVGDRLKIRNNLIAAGSKILE